VNGHLRVLATLHVGGRGPAHHVRGWVPPQDNLKAVGKKKFLTPTGYQILILMQPIVLPLYSLSYMAHINVMHS